MLLMHIIKSVLERVCNCMDEQALCCEMVVSSYMYQPNHSYADFMFRLHSDLTWFIVVKIADVLQCLVKTIPLREYPTGLGHYKLDSSFLSTAHMHFEVPPKFFIIAFCFYYNKNIYDLISFLKLFIVCFLCSRSRRSGTKARALQSAVNLVQ